MLQNKKKIIYKILNQIKDPELMLPITKLGMVKEIDINSNIQQIRIKILLTSIKCPLKMKIKEDIKKAIFNLKLYKTIKVNFGIMNSEEINNLKLRIQKLRLHSQNFGFDVQTTQIFAISSGKGGVGKSTIASNLACAFMARGLRVALIDADIYGFSIPDLMGYQPTSLKRINNMIIPPINHGVKIISIGMFLKTNKPILWRGPMLHRALEQFMKGVLFDKIDIMLIDLPPGTGDIAISLSQILPNINVIIITTPQITCTNVAERAGYICKNTGQNITGIIENMSYFETTEKVKINIFGSGGGNKIVKNLSKFFNQKIPLLGQIPLNLNIRKSADIGTPCVLNKKYQTIRKIFFNISKNIY